MFYVSEVYDNAPAEYQTSLQQKVYLALDELDIPYLRVSTDEAITMDDCILINRALDMKMVKTLFLCNRQKNTFYLYITEGGKPFSSKDFSRRLNVSRVSFAPAQIMNDMLETKIGAATIFSALLPQAAAVSIIIDKAAADETYYGCSDGTTTGYMKIKTDDILHRFLPYTNHTPVIAEI